MRKKTDIEKTNKPIKKWGENEWLLLAFMLIVIMGCIIYFSFNFESVWEALKDIFTYSSSSPPISDYFPVFNFLIQMIVFLILLWKIPNMRSWISETIGEGRSIQHRRHRFILPFLIALPFVFYVLFSGVKESVPPVVEFSLIAVAPTLGGLILAAANRRTQKKGIYNELVSVAQKLIVATILLIIFASLFFTSDFSGGINVNSVEWSGSGFLRWACFWGSAWSFYTGTFLFLLGISDLVLALRHLRK